MAKILTDAEIIARYPYDESENKIRYECRCGSGDYFETTRNWRTGGPQYDLSKVGGFMEVQCRVCGAPRTTFRLVKQNYEKRRELATKNDEEIRRQWKPIGPRELLRIVEGYREEE